MTVIAMTREMGSRGRDVAVSIAEDLGLELVQHELVEHVADKMHVRETSVNRFLEGKSGLFERWGINESDLSLFTTEEILEVAARGNVLIRGWGASYVLRTLPQVLCVRVCAPLELRADTLMERLGLQDREVAYKEIHRNDAAHSRNLMHNFHVSYEDPLLYDLVLNTGKLAVADCAAAIKAVLAGGAFESSDAGERLLRKKMMEARIRTALRASEPTSRLPPSFEVSFDPDTSTAVLSGISYEGKFKLEAGKVVAALDGVESVENELIAVDSFRYGP